MPFICKGYATKGHSTLKERVHLGVSTFRCKTTYTKVSIFTTAVNMDLPVEVYRTRSNVSLVVGNLNQILVALTLSIHCNDLSCGFR